MRPSAAVGEAKLQDTNSSVQKRVMYINLDKVGMLMIPPVDTIGELPDPGWTVPKEITGGIFRMESHVRKLDNGYVFLKEQAEGILDKLAKTQRQRKKANRKLRLMRIKWNSQEKDKEMVLKAKIAAQQAELARQKQQAKDRAELLKLMEETSTLENPLDVSFHVAQKRKHLASAVTCVKVEESEDEDEYFHRILDENGEVSPEQETFPEEGYADEEGETVPQENTETAQEGQSFEVVVQRKRIRKQNQIEKETGDEGTIAYPKRSSNVRHDDDAGSTSEPGAGDAMSVDTDDLTNYAE